MKMPKYLINNTLGVFGGRAGFRGSVQDFAGTIWDFAGEGQDFAGGLWDFAGGVQPWREQCRISREEAGTLRERFRISRERQRFFNFHLACHSVRAVLVADGRRSGTTGSTRNSRTRGNKSPPSPRARSNCRA